MGEESALGRLFHFKINQPMARYKMNTTSTPKSMKSFHLLYAPSRTQSPQKLHRRYCVSLLLAGLFTLATAQAREADREVRGSLVDILPMEVSTEFYQISAFPGALDLLGKDLADWLFWASIHFEMDQLADVDSTIIWNESGFPGLTGIALRSNRDDGHPDRFVNETALLFSDTPKGFFSILAEGKVADPLAGRLPADAFFAVSLSVDLREVFQSTWNMLVAAEAEPIMRTWAEMQEIGPLAHLGPQFDFLPQLGEMFFSGPIRYDLALRPAPGGGMISLGFPFDEIEIPEWEGYLRMDSQGIAMLGTMDRNGGEDLLQHLFGEEGFARWGEAIEGREHAWRFDFSEAEDDPTDGSMEIMEVDFSTGSVRFWTTKAFYAEMAEGTGLRLAEDPAYLCAAGDTGAPVELYVAPAFLNAFDEFFRMVFSEETLGVPRLSGLQRHVQSMFGSGEPYAWSLRREGQVIRHRSYAPASHKSKTALAYLTIPAILVQPMVEATLEARDAAQATYQLSQLRKISAGANMFMLEQNKSQASLADVWSALEMELTPVLGGTFPEFIFDLDDEWTYTYIAPDGRRFHLEHTGRIWMEE